MPVTWKKSERDVLTAEVGPFSVKVQPKGDGRWTWEVRDRDKPNPMATGVGASLGAAKTAAEQFVVRSGRV